MRSGLSAPLHLADDDDRGLRSFARRQAGRAAGAALLAGVGFHARRAGHLDVDDPSFSHATDSPVTNAMGYPGAVVSDIGLQFFGLGGGSGARSGGDLGLLLRDRARRRPDRPARALPGSPPHCCSRRSPAA